MKKESLASDCRQSGATIAGRNAGQSALYYSMSGRFSAIFGRTRNQQKSPPPAWPQAAGVVCENTGFLLGAPDDVKNLEQEIYCDDDNNHGLTFPVSFVWRPGDHLPAEERKARGFASHSFKWFALVNFEGVCLHGPGDPAVSPLEIWRDPLALRPGFAAGLPCAELRPSKFHYGVVKD